MGIDYYLCEICRDTFADCGPYFSCGGCGNNLCDPCAREYKCGRYSDLPVEIDEYGENYEEDWRGCPFCSLEKISQDSLLQFALVKLGKTKEELENEYRQSIQL